MSRRSALLLLFLISFLLVMLLSGHGLSSLLPTGFVPSFLTEISATHRIQFKESKLAHQLLDGLRGIEIGPGAHNPFGLNTLNVDFTANKTIWKKCEGELAGKNVRLDVIAMGDNLPFPDESYDFVLSSHVIEHFYDPIKAIKEWFRVIRKGGYVYMIVPHKERTTDKKKTRTTLAELLERHEHPNPPADDAHLHHSFWVTEDFLELCRHFKWKIAAMQDVDDKVGNGFTVVLQKE